VIRPHIIIGLIGACLLAVGTWMEVVSPVETGSMIQMGLGPLDIMSAHWGLILAAFGAVLLIFGLWRRRRRAELLRSRLPRPAREITVDTDPQH
jgi:hypothetical protein